MISEYSKMSFAEIDALDCVTYRKILKDSIIWGLEQSNEGKDYLEKCWIIEQKEEKPDYAQIKEKLNVRFR